MSGSPGVSLTCLPLFLVSLHLSPDVSFLVSLHFSLSLLMVPGSLGASPNLFLSGVRLSRCLSLLVSFLFSSVLVVSGSLDVSLSLFLFIYLSPSVQLSGCFSFLVSLHVCPTLSCGVRLSRCLFLCFHSSLIMCLPPCGSQFICLQLNLSPIIGLP